MRALAIYGGALYFRGGRQDRGSAGTMEGALSQIKIALTYLEELPIMETPQDRGALPIYGDVKVTLVRAPSIFCPRFTSLLETPFLEEPPSLEGGVHLGP